jgi:hypothetical protein
MKKRNKRNEARRKENIMEDKWKQIKVAKKQEDRDDPICYLCDNSFNYGENTVNCNTQNCAWKNDIFLNERTIWIRKPNEMAMTSISSSVDKLRKERNRFVKWKMDDEELERSIEEMQINNANMQKEESDPISYLCDNSLKYRENPAK